MINQERLKELLVYDKDTGIFTYRSGKVIRPAPTARYMQIQIQGTHYLLHRLAFLYVNAAFPDEVDHINGNKLDNRWDNLRNVSKQQNQWNKTIASNNSVGIKGITWCGHSHFVNPRQQYSAKVRYGRGQRLIKSFSVAKYGSKELALQAANLWLIGVRQKLHEEFTNHGDS